MTEWNTVSSCLDHLECSSCGAVRNAFERQSLCPLCGRPLLARYDLPRAARTLDPGVLSSRPSTLWRYREVLPAAGEPVSLGEGWTPLLQARRLGEALGLDLLYIKDESANPTGSFKARGLSAAVTMAKERGFTRLAIPTAGNAGLAMAAYASAAGMSADVFCPRDTPSGFVRAARFLGARVTLVDGFITDCGRLVREGTEREGWFDLSTLKEPYRLEGKKTMGYEIYEQLGGRLPGAIIYPTGGGTGLVGMWKAFQEMEVLGWIGPERPRMVSVQAAGCAPIVRAFARGEEAAEPWEHPATLASGLRVPAAVGDKLMLCTLRDSGGTALAVSDEEMLEGVRLLGSMEGVLAAPEGGAVTAAARVLARNGFLGRTDSIVLFNTGTALSYLDALPG
jgi:threonine synthase